MEFGSGEWLDIGLFPRCVYFKVRYQVFFAEEIPYTDLRENGIISTNILTNLRE